MILYEFDQKAHDKIMYEDGREDGRAEGREDERKDIVVNMLNDHAPLDLISKYSNWGVDKICEIARQNNIAIN